MRLAKFNDGWRRTRDLSNYNCQLRRVSINNVEGISDSFCLELNNGISVICGKNGVGKSTILKSIYSCIKKDNAFRSRLNVEDINLSIFRDNSEIDNIEEVIVNYLEPSVECNKVISFLHSSENIDDFIEGLEPNGILGKEENINIIGNIIGKVYSKIEVYEVEGALADDYTFPFIKVSLPNGAEYTCLDMGAGEYLCMYIFWFINWIENNSILLIDEIENCISVYSQECLMDYLAHISSRKGIWILLSSHSESILNKIGIGSARLIYNTRQMGISVASPRHERKYFTELGIKSRKKGIFIVEDKFAFFFLKCILNRVASDIAHDYHIVSFKDGESDIEKVVKHFNPNKDIEFRFLAVFDADMREKISRLVGKTVSVVSLPSTNELNPEAELWSIFPKGINDVAKSIGIDPDDLFQYYERCTPLDHHDRFMSLAVYLNISEEVLFNNMFSVWHLENEELVNKFIFSILIANNNFNPEEIRVLAEEMQLKNFQFDDQSLHQKIILFDGKELLLR
ncbi:ATP-binding protein [Cronobacter dublinensis]|uniref:ATP-dependent nuclease n=1 Tax=Cronobacter dublinensis TaxID=413497 RepID=UPI0029303524|nr:AAA family ATPase [Cronobacter dublinensis]WNY83431.1 ATP-binding protein [Cronobacter dublinensis]